MGAAGSTDGKPASVVLVEEEFKRFTLDDVECCLARTRNVVGRKLLACQRTAREAERPTGERRGIFRSSTVISTASGEEEKTEHVSLFGITVTMSEYYELFGTCRLSLGMGCVQPNALSMPCDPLLRAAWLRSLAVFVCSCMLAAWCIVVS